MMETKPRFSNKTLLLAAGACSLILLFACGLSAALGAGGLWWLASSRQAADKSAQALPVARAANDPAAAAVTAARGWVEVLGPDGVWAPAEVQELVAVGQHVRTGALSSAELLFNDGSAVTLQAGSELVIDQLNTPSDGGARQIILTQLSGESRHQVAHNTRPGSQYLVNTPYGQGEAKGTSFTVIVIAAGADGLGGSVDYEVTEGVVAVTAVEITVQVSAGQITTIAAGEAPLEPVMSITGQGVVTQTGETWTIAGQEFEATEGTVITGDPQIGDWAVVKGRVREDGANEAVWITLLRTSPANRFSISGLVEAAAEKEWTVQGQKIVIDGQTQVDEGLAVGDQVRVTGLVLDGGVFQAKSIERIETEDGLRFEFTGVVQALSEVSWTVSGAILHIDEETVIDEGLAEGDLVKVSGLIDEEGAWLAQSITAAPDEDSRFHLTGKLDSLDPWQAAGVTFETREWTAIEDGLEIGDLVRVEGQIDEDGLWVADTIERLADETTRLVLTGTVISMDPWVINGIPITITAKTLIGDGIEVGMLVRVEILIAKDGTWQIVSIERLQDVIWFPGCMDIVATVVSLRDNDIQLAGWPLMDIEKDVQVEGRLAPQSVVRFRICFNDEHDFRIIFIIIVDDDDNAVTPPTDVDGGKVTVCHKPGKKKGGHTLTVGRPALGAHLGHGDTLGACR